MKRDTAYKIAHKMLENVTIELQNLHQEVSRQVTEAHFATLPDAVKEFARSSDGLKYLSTSVNCYINPLGYKNFICKAPFFFYVNKRGDDPRVNELVKEVEAIHAFWDKREALENKIEELANILFKLRTEKRILEHFPECADIISPFFPAKNTDVLVINDKLKDLVKCSVQVKKDCSGKL